MNEISPLEMLKTSFRNWWIVTLFMLIGAMAGLLFHLTRGALYETRAVITVSIDFTRTGFMTDIEEDTAIVVVGDVIKSTEVINQVIASASEKGIVYSEIEFREISFMDRQSESWFLRVRHPDPQTASLLANLWAEKAAAALDDALLHALNAETLIRSLDDLSDCMVNVALMPAHPDCNLDNLENIQKALEETGRAAQEELLASKGILPASVHTWTEEAPLPVNKAAFGRNTMIFFGATAGFFFSLIYSVFGLSLGKKGDDAH
ncbi:MAG: hypothetical protein JEZ06_16470 [Anaerolineaceae bacterium]|nr:hypothetical protein [Anaerolineaceae bacterium]